MVSGYVHPPDTGACQINTAAHAERLEELDIDAFTESGNIEFALLLYSEAGTTPWIASKYCWEAYI